MTAPTKLPLLMNNNKIASKIPIRSDSFLDAFNQMITEDEIAEYIQKEEYDKNTGISPRLLSALQKIDNTNKPHPMSCLVQAVLY